MRPAPCSTSANRPYDTACPGAPAAMCIWRRRHAAGRTSGAGPHGMPSASVWLLHRPHCPALVCALRFMLHAGTCRLAVILFAGWYHGDDFLCVHVMAPMCAHTRAHTHMHRHRHTCTCMRTHAIAMPAHALVALDSCPPATPCSVHSHRGAFPVPSLHCEPRKCTWHSWCMEAHSGRYSPLSRVGAGRRQAGVCERRGAGSARDKDVRTK